MAQLNPRDLADGDGSESNIKRSFVSNKIPGSAAYMRKSYLDSVQWLSIDLSLTLTSDEFNW